ncbi:MAG: GntR family transcriptional regulator [Pseudomonadota bacterium]
MADKEPLYMRVRRTLIERLARADWRPGNMIPSEIALGEEMGVSQGTVRKAVDSLCADGALRRVQGSGTFVAKQTPEMANFKFLRLADGAGNRVFPELQRQISGVESADAVIAGRLALEDGARVHVLDRVRSVDGVNALIERISVPEAIMPGLSNEAPLPNALYPHYQGRFGVHVMRTEDAISAVTADAAQAKVFGVKSGAPLLALERVAYDLTGRAVEHRRSHVLTTALSFRVELR